MPEYESYIEDSPELVDSFTQKECGYVAETLALAALQSGQNVIVDSSLRQASWYVKYMEKLRSDFPSIKIALIHVVAKLETVLIRVKHRARETGRSIDEDDILSTIAQTEKSVKIVEPAVDYCCRISNDTDGLQISAPGGWERFRENFEQGKPITIPQLERLKTTELDKLTAASKERKHRRRFSTLRSSEENHMSESLSFYGPFAHIRGTLDYTFHSNYTFERQRFQDAVVNEFLNGAVIFDKNGEVCTTPTEPWLVFTAGPMGAGKSYTMRKLVERGYFPLLAFVRVDPDEIRRYLPEFHLYVEQSPELAGELTRKEAGFISEILTLAGLQAGRNVLVDGR